MLRRYLVSLLLCSAPFAAAQNPRNPMQQANDAAEELAAITLAPLPVPAATPPRAAPRGQEGGPVRISGGVMASQVLTRVNPTYPPEAKAKRISGTVVLSATIGSDGMVQDLSVISGPAALEEAALNAVKQWTYRPYVLNGNPVEVRTTVTVNFSLNATP